MKIRYVILIFLLVIIGGHLINTIPQDPVVDVSNGYIVKEKMTLIENSGTSKYYNYHLYYDVYYEPYDADLHGIFTYYDDDGNCLGQTESYYFSTGENHDFLDNFDKVSKVNIVIYQDEGNIIYDLLGYKNLVYNGTIYKVVKNSTVRDNTFEETTTEDYSEEDDYYSSYDSYYSSSYDSYYDSDYSGNSYASEPVTGGSYVGSKNSDKFHYSSCGHAERIKSSNRIYFSSRQEALNNGYEPCGHCNP